MLVDGYSLSATQHYRGGIAIDKLKLALLAIGAVLTGAAALALQPAAPPEESAPSNVSMKIIDQFLDESRRHLGL